MSQDPTRADQTQQSDRTQFATPEQQSASGRAQREDRKMQELGRKIVGGFFMILRSLKLYDLENDIFVKPLHELESAINWVVAREGMVSLYGNSSTIYLNQRLLRFDRASLENVNYLLQQFEERGLAGFVVEHPITLGQLQEFLKQFGPGNQSNHQFSSSAFKGQARAKVRERLERLENEELTRVSDQKADRRRYAVLLYGRLLQFVRDLYDPTTETPPFKKASHIIQEIIDLCKGQPVQFLGFSNETEASEYQAYHVANTVLLSLIFGDYLGLDRIQMLELGLITLKHDLGKLYLAEGLLYKRAEPSAEERKEIERLPVYTIKEILRGNFSWEKMKHAIIIAGLTMRPGDEPWPPADIIQPAPSWVYSRIISLCACFDALCSERPFRHKMRPDDALAFMQQRLANQFDPYLLKLFNRLFGSIVIRVIGQTRPPSEPAPVDKRKLQQKIPLPVLQRIHKELKEYRELRQVANPSPQQQHRLAFLKKFLTFKLKEQV